MELGGRAAGTGRPQDSSSLRGELKEREPRSSKLRQETRQWAGQREEARGERHFGSAPYQRTRGRGEVDAHRARMRQVFR